MQKDNNPITSECPLFVCRECHTKTVHPHQKWCTLPDNDVPECEKCFYRRAGSEKCGHPYRKKGGDVK